MKKKVNKKRNNKNVKYGFLSLLCEVLLISLFVAGSYACLIKYDVISVPNINSNKSNEIDYVENVNIGVGEKFYVNTSNNKYVWRSIDDKVAKVDDGLIEGVAIGETNVTFEDDNGNKKTVYVYVNDDNISSRANSNQDTYVITYNGNGGTTSKTGLKTTCTKGKSCSIMSNVYSKTGYTFIGWTTKSNGANDGYNWTGWSGTWNFTNGKYGISSNKLVLYAMWDANSNSADRYTISYNSNGGSGKMADQICIIGQTCTVRANAFTKSGASFSGFATTASASNPGYNWTGWTGTWNFKNGQYGIKNNKLVLYARWKASSTPSTGETFTIKFMANGGSGTMASQTCIKGQKCTIKNSTFTKTGYKFIKWRTTASASTPGYNWTNWTGTWNFSNGQYGINNNTLTLYATWEKKTPSTVEDPDSNTITIRYMPNGGTGSMPDTKCTYGQKCTISANKYSKNGYKFIKWRTTASTSVAGYNWTNWSGTWTFKNGQYGITNNTLTLYATWQSNVASGDNYLIIYNANGGSGTMANQTCTYGKACTIKTSSYTRSGYTFKGWTTNKDGKDDSYKWTGFSATWTFKNGQNGVSNNQLKLYAMWKKKGAQDEGSHFSSTYDVTTDSRYNSGYKAVTSYNGSTLKYKLVTKNNNDYMLIRVSDPTKQLMTAFPTWGKVYSAEDIMNAEIKSYGYQNKAMIAVNASFFNMGSSNTPCGQYMLNKGKEMHALGTGKGGTVAGLGSDGLMRSYGFNGSNNSSVKNTILSAGVKNTWAVFGDIIGWDGGTTNNTGGNNGTQRTILCQFDANNFILFSGHGVLKNVANMLKSENGCKYAVNLDGGGSRKMYYKTNAQATLTKRYGGSRLIPDLLYFVEQ